MTNYLKIAGCATAMLMLGVSFASAQAPAMGRGDQSGGGAAQMSTKPMGSPEVAGKGQPRMKSRMMKTRMSKKQMMRQKRMMHHKQMMHDSM